MLIIKMPGGDVEYVNANDLLWMRQAFPSELKDAVMLRIGNDRLLSVEALDELKGKFAGGGVVLADFTPPEGTVSMVVNARSVREVEPSNPDIYHEQARSVLKFAARIRLAVRETVEEARRILEQVVGPRPKRGARVARRTPTKRRKKAKSKE